MCRIHPPILTFQEVKFLLMIAFYVDSQFRILHNGSCSVHESSL